MIIRILGEGQFDLTDADAAFLAELDDELMLTVEADDATGFRLTLGDLLATIRELGVPVAPDRLVPSDSVLPSADTPLSEVRALLRDAGNVAE